MPAAIYSAFRSPKGVALLLAALALLIYVFFLPKSDNSGAGKGPKFDLIFGVSTVDPELKTTVIMSPYVIGGTLYVEAQKLPANEGTLSTRVTLYRYDNKTGIAKPLLLPGDSELQAIEVKKRFVVDETRHIHLDTSEKSPDGYSLAEPHWVEVDPIRNVIGNIVLFALSGHFQKIKERESNPRLANDSVSVAINAGQPIFNHEGDNAFLLGWIVPDKPSAPRE